MFLTARSYAVGLAMVVLMLPGAAALGGGQMQTVAVTGEAAPETASGVEFLSFGFPVLNDAGQVAFRAFLAGSGVNSSNDLGIWVGEPGGLSLVARRGSQAPGTAAGVNFLTLVSTVLNDAGQVAFRSTLTGSGVGSSNDQGIWRGDGSSLSLVARSGSAAPGTAVGVTYSSLNLPMLNDAGQVAFRGFLTGSGVDSSNDSGIWRGGPGSLSLVARRGSAAAGTAVGVNFGPFSTPVLNDVGQVAFFANLTGTGVTGSNNEGIWRGEPGSLSLVARRGNQAPGTGTGVNFGSLSIPVLNDAGQVAFRSGLAGSGVDSSNNEGIWRGGPGSLSLVARTGSHAAGTPAGANFFSLDEPVLNNAGQVAFRAFLTGSGVDSSNNLGIWLGGPGTGSLNVVSRSGSAAPGTAPGANYFLFSTPVLNDAGQVGFTASLTGSGVDSSNDQGLWIGDGSESLLIARKGEVLAGRTISSLVLSTGSGGSDGRENGLNEFAQVTYRATFTDGGEGVFLFTPDVHWRRTFSGPWDVASNWTVSILPGSPHSVLIDPEVSLTVTGPAGPVSVSSLQIGGGNGIATLSLSGGVVSVLGEPVNIMPTGVLTGNGSLNANVLNTGGTIAPGLSPGTLTIAGDFEQTAGMVAIELAGYTPDDEHDLLIVTGNATLGGAMAVSLIDDGFIPLPGAEFEVMSYGSRSGEFDMIVSETAFPGLWFDAEYGPEGLILRASALPGDANLDGQVTIADLGILAANWQQTGKTWLQADFNGDGGVTIADLGILAGNWQAGVGGFGPTGSGVGFVEALGMFDAFAGVVVPEPAGVVGYLLMLGVLGWRRRWRIAAQGQLPG